MQNIFQKFLRTRRDVYFSIVTSKIKLEKFQNLVSHIMVP